MKIEKSEVRTKASRLIVSIPLSSGFCILFNARRSHRSCRLFMG
ncbi:MAG: hypothetical protein SV062_02075 [Thermodesulfobacteriota bacterium]|nr:hypothetical protein [Thermodesulfobacteriota bacterium]